MSQNKPHKRLGIKGFAAEGLGEFGIGDRSESNALVGVMVGRESLFNTGVFSSLIMPSDRLYRYVVYLIKPTERAIVPDLAYSASPLGPFDPLASPSVYVPLYAVIFIAVLLLGAMIVFRRRDL